jgi:hypothetical protein
MLYNYSIMNKISKNILSEINRYREIVGLNRINEQSETGEIYTFGSLDVEVKNGEVFWLKRTSETSPVQKINLGNQNDIEYDITVKEVTGNEKGKNNTDVTKFYYDKDGINSEFYPMQQKVERYGGFFAISVNSKINKPVISSYILRGPVDKTQAEGFSAGVMSDKDNIIGYKKYWCKNQRRGKDCYYLELSSGQPASLINGGDAIVTKQKVIEIPFSFTEPFIFDTIELTSEVQSEFDKKVELLKSYLEQVKGYSDFLKGKTILVRAYASRDNDPTKKVSGKFTPCKGFGDGTRGQYNQCLSQKRAEKIVKLLSSEFPELNFKPRGMGETDSFGPGWTTNNSPTPAQTQPNRRFDVLIPKFTRVDDLTNN